MPKLTDIIGQSVLIKSRVLDDNKAVLVKLIDVENGGIWIESQPKTDELLEFLGVSAAPKTPIFFLPFAQIAWLQSWLEIQSLSEKSFGVE